MDKEKISASEFFNQKTQREEYDKIYEELDFKEEYPANKRRLEIFKEIINLISPKSMLDAGCGNGKPLISICKSGYNCIGFDKAPSMVEEAKRNLKLNGLSEDLISEGDFETFLSPKKFDCILGMGSFYYAKDPVETIRRMASFLEDEGSMIFSLRNQIMHLRFCHLPLFYQKLEI